jgi:hypothetical protein
MASSWLVNSSSRSSRIDAELLKDRLCELRKKAAAGLPHFKKPGDLGLLGLATEECRDVEIVAGNFARDIADILLYLVDDGLLFVGNSRG